MTRMRTQALFIVLFFWLTGCTGAAPSAAPLPTETAAATQPVATRPAVTMVAPTHPPTQTPLPSITPTVTQTATTTPDPALAEVRLLGVSWLANYDLLLSFEFPGPVNPEAYRVVVEDKEYTCQVLAQQPDRLFCTGQGMNVYGRITVRIFPTGSDQPGFEGKISVPYFTD